MPLSTVQNIIYLKNNKEFDKAIDKKKIESVNLKINAQISIKKMHELSRILLSVAYRFKWIRACFYFLNGLFCKGYQNLPTALKNIVICPQFVVFDRCAPVSMCLQCCICFVVPSTLLFAGT